MYRDLRVLVAGGTGVIGIPIVFELVKRGAKVTVVGMEEESVASRHLPKNVQYKRRNLLVKEQCQDSIRGNSVVINCAGTKRSVGIGYNGISKFFVDMLNLQTNIMDVSHSERVDRFLFIGSIAEYPPLNLRNEDEVWNGKPDQNDWFTGVQKRIGEAQGEAYFLDTGWDAVRVIRPSNVYGPFDNFGIVNSQVIPSLISKLLRNSSELEILGDGSNIRDFIFSHDVAYWALEALENAPPNYPINIGSGIGTKIIEIVETLCKILEINPILRFSASIPTGDPSRVLSVQRARDTLGFTPRVSLEEGLRKTVSWYQENPSWNSLKYV